MQNERTAIYTLTSKMWNTNDEMMMRNMNTFSAKFDNGNDFCVCILC